MKSTIILFCLLCCFSSSIAQQSVNATGGNATGSGGSVSYSVGQLAYTTISNSVVTINQGVQLPYEIITLGTDDFSTIVLEMKVSPNPTQSNVVLKITDFPLEKLFYEVTDLNGKKIISEKILNFETPIFLENQQLGVYFVTVYQENKKHKTFKIIKN